ncbi:MAG: hypothetical protein FRX49_12486, partial [Trebouxia sp. A1-2]
LRVQAYTDLDNIGRLALAAICRSCHVRLRSDTFAGILDDSPTLRGVVSSSTLQAMQHINNFLLRDKLGDQWTMAVSEEGLKSKGFMTVIAARDTRAAGNVPHVCKMQVKDALGSWKDVHLGPNEVAVMFGQTATQASAGLFRPATYRVVSMKCCMPLSDMSTNQLFWPFNQQSVGELYSSCHGNQVHTGRQSVAYHLNARPSAVLNFHDILEDAGHCVPDRHAFQNCSLTLHCLYTQPVCMKDLLQRFDTVLTPPSMFKSAAARSIQLGTIDAAAAKKKRKRQVTPVSSPVTRSGRVRRSTAGLLGEPAHAKSSYANEVQKTGDFAAMVQAMRVYLTVDGNTFLRQSGLRVQGSELLMDLKLAEDETLAMLPVQPNTAEEVAPNDND